MLAIDDGLSLADARAIYFSQNGFPPDGGYAQRWVKVKLGRIPVYILNTRPRRRAVPLHDLHHVLTGYDTSNVGEAEIGAWELAAGTWPHYVATALDLAATAFGLLLAPVRVFRAFVRGRHSRTLYRETVSEALLAARVGEVRARLGLVEQPPQATFGDRLAFVGLALGSLLALASFVVLAPLLVIVGPFLP